MAATTNMPKPVPSWAEPLINLEALWVRLNVEGRVRVRDAARLRHLGIPPFDGERIYRTDAAGYVVAVGMPDREVAVLSSDIRRAFEARFGVPKADQVRAPNRRRAVG